MPDACTLPTAEQPIRTAEFDRFFTNSVREMRRPGPQRLELVLAGDAEPLARDPAARESSCWSFFALAVGQRDRRETFGQYFCIVVVAPASLAVRYHEGNTGRARVGLRRPMLTPPDLAALLCPTAA